MKRFATLLCSLLLIFCLNAAVSAAYTDVPADSWAGESIEKAAQYDLMQGLGNGLFGYGNSISRAEFVTVLVRMLGWDTIGQSAGYTHWADEYIGAAAQNGAIDAAESFRPDDAITREEMSVMLVRALGLGALADEESDAALPFLDVSKNKGYIAIAYEIGMTKGMSETEFAPNATATREQAATMLVRIHEKYNQKTAWKHAFYAISSYSQIDLVKEFDEVSLGWARMTYSEDGGAKLLTKNTNNNEYYIPGAYAGVLEELNDAGVSLKLDVFMSGSSLRKMLADEAAREQAVSEIMNELTREYADVGYNPYSGVTVDFEGLRASDSENFIAFLASLKSQLGDRTLYTAVMPATPDGIYYDGYNFAALGRLCDRVILMAHDYATTNLSGFLGTKYHQTQALTPLYKVYYAVRHAARAMDEPEKLALQISMDAMAWKINANERLTATSPTRPIHTTVYQRLTNGAVRGWSSSTRNAYAMYQTEAGQNIFLWYENERSIGEKVGVSKLLGITGVSVWRLGLIPNYADEGLSYDAMHAID